MHGSPMSKWDSRLLWKYFDYKDFGLIGEPYFDIDFTNVLYLTDTGRCWDGASFKIRDKDYFSGCRAQYENYYADWKVKPINYRLKFNIDTYPIHLFLTSNFKIHSTFDIIKAANENILPEKILMTVHPQRWTDKPIPWIKELVWQNVKNIGKFMLVKRNENFLMKANCFRKDN